MLVYRIEFTGLAKGLRSTSRRRPCDKPHIYRFVTGREVHMLYGALGHNDGDLDEDVRLGRHTEEVQMDMDQFRDKRNKRPKRQMVNFDAGWQFWEFCSENAYNRGKSL